MIKGLFSYTFAKNYQKRSLFEKVMAKIKRCSFFAPQCIYNGIRWKCCWLWIPDLCRNLHFCQTTNCIFGCKIIRSLIVRYWSGSQCSFWSVTEDDRDSCYKDDGTGHLALKWVISHTKPSTAQISILSDECQLPVWEPCWRSCLSDDFFCYLLKLWNNMSCCDIYRWRLLWGKDWSWQ